AQDGSLYYLYRGAWVKDREFRPNTGSLWKVRFTGDHTPPGILTQPYDQTVTRGKGVSFRVAASGSPPLHFQWRRNDTPITGATSASYTLPSISDVENGAYFVCVVSNAFGRATSNPAKLTVRPPVAASWISPHPGVYTGPIDIRLRPDAMSGTLHYTTDGRKPSADSPVYTTPFTLRQGATIRALVYEGAQSV